MRHQHRDLAITDFPTAYGQWIPDTSAAAITKLTPRATRIALSDVSACTNLVANGAPFSALCSSRLRVPWFVVSALREKISRVARDVAIRRRLDDLVGDLSLSPDHARRVDDLEQQSR